MGETLLFPCAGAAYCGRIAYQSALEMTSDGTGQVFCLAAVAAGIDDKLERTRNAGRRVAIDGCDDECARKTLELAGMPVESHLVLTALGIEKKPDRPDLTGDVALAVERTKELLVF